MPVPSISCATLDRGIAMTTAAENAVPMEPSDLNAKIAAPKLN
jgi:hypothetical protein